SARGRERSAAGNYGFSRSPSRTAPMSRATSIGCWRRKTTRPYSSPATLCMRCCRFPAPQSSSPTAGSPSTGGFRTKRDCLTVAAALAPLLGEAVFQALGHAWRDEPADVAAQAANLLHEARRDELVAIGSHEEHGLDRRVEPVVHSGHLEFVFE